MKTEHQFWELLDQLCRLNFERGIAFEQRRHHRGKLPSVKKQERQLKRRAEKMKSLVMELGRQLRSPLPNDKRKRLQTELNQLKSDYYFSLFQSGMFFERMLKTPGDRSEDEAVCEKFDADEKAMRLKIAALERQLSGSKA